MLTTIAVVIAVLIIVYLFMTGPRFGGNPRGARLERIRKSPGFRQGQFQNLKETPSLTDNANILTVTRKFFFAKDKRNRPASAIPSTKTDLHALLPDEEVLVWFGHSSYFIQLAGKRILVDPVFSGNASPFSFTTSSFKGSDVYKAEDIPFIDYLFITHDHYDHLDYETIHALKDRIGQVVTGLGVGAHLERWGLDPATILELDWNESLRPGDQFVVHARPARHFSGRGFKRNGTLWLSLVLLSPAYRIYIGGDSGYDDHFVEIGREFGPFDLVILENGQYNEYWKYIHMMPEEVVQAAIDLNAKSLFPVHWSKFSLSIHAWDEPILRLSKEAKRRNQKLVHPLIGEKVQLSNLYAGVEWWKLL